VFISSLKPNEAKILQNLTDATSGGGSATGKNIIDELTTTIKNMAEQTKEQVDSARILKDMWKNIKEFVEKHPVGTQAAFIITVAAA